jgi:hypothetical protein
LTDFENTDYGLRNMFPNIFTTCTSIPVDSGPPSDELCRHFSRDFLGRYHTAAFCFAIAHAKQRVAAVCAFQGLARSSGEHVQRALERLRDPNVANALRFAASNPNHPESSALAKDLEQLLLRGGASVPFSNEEKASIGPHIKAVCLRHCLLNTLETFAPSGFDDDTSFEIVLAQARAQRGVGFGNHPAVDTPLVHDTDPFLGNLAGVTSVLVDVDAAAATAAGSSSSSGSGSSSSSAAGAGAGGSAAGIPAKLSLNSSTVLSRSRWIHFPQEVADSAFVRQKIQARYPIVPAMAFERLRCALFAARAGSADTQRVTKARTTLPMGISGRIAYQCGVTEEQKRGTPHNHSVFMGCGLSQSMVRQAAANPALSSLLVRIANYLSCSRIATELLEEADSLRKAATEERRPHPRAREVAVARPPPLGSSDAEFAAFWESVCESGSRIAALVNRHGHSATCASSHRSSWAHSEVCRLAFSRPISGAGGTFGADGDFLLVEINPAIAAHNRRVADRAKKGTGSAADDSGGPNAPIFPLLAQSALENPQRLARPRIISLAPLLRSGVLSPMLEPRCAPPAVLERIDDDTTRLRQFFKLL